MTNPTKSKRFIAINGNQKNPKTKVRLILTALFSLNKAPFLSRFSCQLGLIIN
ncbi:hypothetical protein MUU45_000263 [Rodentibacter pneumotropicus]|uniref:Uncharacterized protein n=1 Tax=Rodentibacter pneumotropicus TaxID=758 RepID=A0AAW5L7U0_9PAST|nr:hypothetical protein [Rodentibacter pneumotropicus]MCQ9120468.1 hypothetical protein [Rodentibacter pneumotropicus]